MDRGSQTSAMANVIEHGELEHGEEIRLDSIEEALEDLKNGKVVIVVDDEQRENEGDFIALAEKASPEVINFMITEGRGLVCVPITRQRAERLGIASYGRAKYRFPRYCLYGIGRSYGDNNGDFSG